MGGRRRTHEEFVSEIKEINPNVEVLSKFTVVKSKVKCMCKIHNKEFEICANNLLQGQGCPICGREKATASNTKPKEKFIEELNKITDTIEVLEYRNTGSKVKCHCKKCNNVWSPVGSTLLKGIGCPVCSGKAVLAGKNDIATTRPDLVHLFKNKEDAKKFSEFSSKEADFKCPDCGKEVKKKIYYVSQNGLCCKFCSDGVSYPNKFIRYLFEELKDDVSYYQSEYTQDNFTYELNGKKKKCLYDMYFIMPNGKKYAIEMDGEFHIKSFSKTEEDTNTNIENDRQKDIVCKENNIKLIRIPCIYPNGNRFEIVKNAILSSELSALFNLSKIDFDKINKGCMTSDIKRVVDLYNTHEFSITEIAKEVGIHRKTVRHHLKIGKELGLCDYTPTRKKSE